MHIELGEPGRLSKNYVLLVRAMAKAARVPVGDLDDVMLERPFTPPRVRCGQADSGREVKFRRGLWRGVLFC